MKKVLLLVILSLFFVTTASAAEPETIKNFNSQIIVNKDSSIQVTETITVHAAGIQIVHGIYRDFPTIYSDSSGVKYKVGFELISVKRDGQDTSYDTENLSNGIRVYIRNKNIELTPGDYTFEIIYQATGELGYFTDHDELYWNVTGNGWAFPIESASAKVILPGEVSSTSLTMTAYSGFSGERGTDFTQQLVSGDPVFTTARTLAPSEGFTIVVGWPKGLVVEQPRVTSTDAFSSLSTIKIDKNQVGLAGLIAAVIVWLYYLLVWWKFGRDPEKEAIIPQYDTPQGFSPAAVGRINMMATGNNLFTASVINLAVKGYLQIIKRDDYSLKKIKAGADLPSEEQAIMAILFKNNSEPEELKISNDSCETFSRAISDHRQELSKTIGSGYFRRNYLWFILGCLLGYVSIAIAVAAISGVFWPFTLVFALVFSFIIYVVTGILITIAILVYSMLKPGTELGQRFIYFFVLGIGLAGCLPLFFFAAAFTLPFIWFFGAYIYIDFGLIIIADIIFSFLLPQRTIEGQKLEDEIKGFKWFMSVTEKDRLNFTNPPNKTPELFEKFLPYALALGVENRWAEQFNGVFAALKEQGREYSPSWYMGSAGMFNASSFASNLGSTFSGAITSAAAPPGSSSGFGGGGGSGGGGGGGGGGGC